MGKQVIMSPLSQSERKSVRSLHTAKGRERQRQFIGEGVRLLEEALRQNQMPLKVYYAESQLHDRGRTLLGRFRKDGVGAEAISQKTLEQIAETEHSQGIIGVFPIPSTDLERISREQVRTVVYFDNISDPGNVGTLLRSALAFGINLAVFSPHSVEPFNGKLVRSSAGAIFGLPIATASIAELHDYYGNGNIQILAADQHGEELPGVLRRLRRNKLLVLAIGCEGTGLSDEVRGLLDVGVRIGHSRRVESLNAAVAGSIIMQELYQRRIGK